MVREATPTKFHPVSLPRLLREGYRLQSFKNGIKRGVFFRIDFIESFGHIISAMALNVLLYCCRKDRASGYPVATSHLIHSGKNIIRDRDCCFHDEKVLLW